MEPAAQTMLGEFRIAAVLGQGGSGIVYDAMWGPRRVALKVMAPGSVGTGKETAQFLAEAQRLQQIGHPSVVKVLSVGQLPDGRPYLAMERLDGETLASVIAHGALPLAHALELFAELCAAVGALHDQGLVHRDLKPENVFVVANRHAVLLDFGIAKDIAAPASTTTAEGNVRGTPAYMAPERFFGQPAGIATDLYELALVLYMMLAGRLPWDVVSDPEARLSPRSLVELVPSVPAALDVELRRALSTRAQNRPVSAAALLDGVRAAASGAIADEPGETARMRPASSHEPQATPLAWAPTLPAPPQPARRRWPIYAAVGVIALGVAAIAAWPRAHHALVTVPAVIAQHAADAADNDPWNAPPKEASTELPLVEPMLKADAYRIEAAAAVHHLPGDTRVVLSAQIAELRAQPQTDQLLVKLGKDPRISALSELVPPCVRSLATEAEWFVFGSTSLATSTTGTLVVRGRWNRKDVEACFGDTAKVFTAADGARLYQLAEFGWLDFIDDHTALVSVRHDQNAEAVHQLARRGAGPEGHTKELVTRLPANRSIAVVVDGHANDDWQIIALPTGSDVYGWIRIDDKGAALDLAADPHTEAAAKAAADAMRPQVDDVFASTDKAKMGRLEVVRDKTIVHVRGAMTTLMIGMVLASSSL